MTSILIWDAPFAEFPVKLSSKYDVIYFWSDYIEPGHDNYFSVPLLLEQNREYCRTHYLDLLRLVASDKFLNQDLPSLYQYSPSTSLWWSSLTHESCSFDKSPLITKLLYSVAFYSHLKKYHQELSSITLFSNCQYLKDSVSNYSSSTNIRFRRLKRSCPQLFPSIALTRRQIFNLLPKSISSLVWLLFFIHRYWHFIIKTSPTCPQNSSLNFISYLIPPSKFSTANQFLSHYWGELPEYLSCQDIPSTWFYFFSPTPSIPSSKKALEILKLLNDKSINQHIGLESFLSLSSIFKSFLSYVKYSFVGYKLEMYGFLRRCLPNNLFPFLIDDFRSSTYGYQLLKSIIYHDLFVRAIRSFNLNIPVFYLQENQDWEYLMLQIFGSTVRSSIVGVPHTTLRFWDLRYFVSAHSVHYKPPIPTYQALNSHHAVTSLCNYQTCVLRKMPVEALRYSHLNPKILNGLYDHGSHANANTIIIIGEYNLNSTLKLLSIISSLPRSILINFKFLFKSHPASTHDYCKLLSSSFISLTTDSLSRLLPSCDIALTSSTSSAAVEAYSSGLKVVTYLEPSGLNCSPLDCSPNVTFFYSREQLLSVLSDYDKTLTSQSHLTRYFYLSDKLYHWRNFLSLLSIR